MIKHVHDYQVSEIFSNQNSVIYRIPKYQREYTWRTRDWDALFDDVVENDEGYFIGSYICVSTSTMGIPELELIDGQQRFTTVALLLANLYSWLIEYKEDDELDDDEITELNNLKNALANKKVTRINGKKNTSYTTKLVLQDQNCNRDDYESILVDYEIIDSATYQNYRGVRRIEKAFKHFDKLINDYIDIRQEEDDSLETIDILFELVNKFKSVTLVGIEVDSHKDAYMMFESLNHRGVPLSAIDLIKNILIAEADSRGVADSCYDEWVAGLKRIGDDYAPQERFFRHWYNAFREELNASFITQKTNKKFPLAYKATKTTLLDIYEKLIRKDFDSFLDDFKNETKVYSIIVNNSTESHVYDSELVDLERIQGTPSHLLLLYLLTEQEVLGISDANIKEIVRILIAFFVRRNVTDVPATRNLDRIFMDCVSEIKTQKGDDVVKRIKQILKTESAPEDLFEQKLKGPMYEDNDMATRFILCGIESQHQTREIYSDLWRRNNNDIYVWTIEHIFPEGEKIPKEWVDMIADGDREKAEEYRRDYVHTLGNLTLTGYNQNLSNMSFEKKKNRTGKDGKSMGYLNGLFLNEDVASEDEWSIEKIKIRTDKLVRIIKDTYKW